MDEQFEIISTEEGDVHTETNVATSSTTPPRRRGAASASSSASPPRFQCDTPRLRQLLLQERNSGRPYDQQHICRGCEIARLSCEECGRRSGRCPTCKQASVFCGGCEDRRANCDRSCCVLACEEDGRRYDAWDTAPPPGGACSAHKEYRYNCPACDHFAGLELEKAWAEERASNSVGRKVRSFVGSVGGNIASMVAAANRALVAPPSEDADKALDDWDQVSGFE